MFWTTTAVLCYAALVIYWSESGRGVLPEVQAIHTPDPIAHDEPIQPIPVSIDLDAPTAELGRRLFHEPRLAADGVRSCAFCHDLAQGGAAGSQQALGLGGQELDVDVPTVLNSGLSFRQFWDGRAVTLEEQVDGPLLASAEMGSSWERVLEVLEGDQSYVESFQEVFAAPPTPERVRVAIATFERSLLTPNARFDEFLRGDENAISRIERNGYELFKDYGCIGCHQGMGVGGNMFQRLGIVRDYFADRGEMTKADLGRYNVTGEEADRHVFKVPSLRNIALTAPYFHDGSADTLDEAIRIMARYQLGREIPDEDVAQIEAFLLTLTGEIAPTS